MRHNRTVLTLAAGTVLAAGTTLLLPLTTQAAVACNETALVTAVNAANAAGGGTVTLTPGCTYILTASHGNDGVRGPAGLPIITTPITFEGNANTITRAPAAAAFRIAQVSSIGGITLKAVTLSGGSRPPPARTTAAASSTSPRAVSAAPSTAPAHPRRRPSPAAR